MLSVWLRLVHTDGHHNSVRGGREDLQGSATSPLQDFQQGVRGRVPPSAGHHLRWLLSSVLSAAGLCCCLQCDHPCTNKRLLAQRLCAHDESSLNNHPLLISSSAAFEVSPWQPTPKSSVGGRQGPMFHTHYTHIDTHTTDLRQAACNWKKNSCSCMLKGCTCGAAPKAVKACCAWDTLYFWLDH